MICILALIYRYIDLNQSTIDPYQATCASATSTVWAVTAQRRLVTMGQFRKFWSRKKKRSTR